MEPVLLHKHLSKLLPKQVYEAIGAKGFLTLNWPWWVVGLVVAIGIAWWGLAPDASGQRRAMGWLGTIGAFAFALLLGLVGLGKLPSQMLQLHTYGVLVAIGFLVGIVLAVREARRAGVDAERILDLAFWLLIAAMVGARLSYVVLRWSEFAPDFKSGKPFLQWKVFRLWEGGLMYYGGFLLALLVSWLFIRAYKLNFGQMADAIIPSVAIGQFFGLLGSYAAGFGSGKMTELPWKVIYSKGAAVRGIGLHPTQIYEALGVLALFFILLWIRSTKRYHGQVFLWYLILYPLMAFFLDMLRASDTLNFIFEHNITPMATGADILSWSQAISVALFAWAFLALTSRRNQSTASS